jgi:hypothetical protein
MPSQYLSPLRLARHSSAARPFTRTPVAKRFLASTPSRRAARNEASDGSSGVVNLGQRSAGFVAAKDEAGNPIGREPGPLYREWLASTGTQFKDPRPHETNYLGGSIVSPSLFIFIPTLVTPTLFFLPCPTALTRYQPFPLNPSFKPPPPLSDRLRNLIFSEWIKNPSQNNPRTLSIRHGISIKRIEAIIRLKVHEHKWKQVRKSFHLVLCLPRRNVMMNKLD